MCGIGALTRYTRLWLITAIESPPGFRDGIRVHIEVFISCIEHLMINENFNIVSCVLNIEWFMCKCC